MFALTLNSRHAAPPMKLAYFDHTRHLFVIEHLAFQASLVDCCFHHFGRLHSAGHLLDVCMHNVGLHHLEPGKRYHFPDGPFVEYKGLFPQIELQTKQRELEQEINALISIGGKVTAAVLPYEEASKLCDGSLPDYIPKGRMPRIVTSGNYPGCPCGGTHVADIAEIKSVKVTRMRMKEVTKVSYVVDN